MTPNGSCITGLMDRASRLMDAEVDDTDKEGCEAAASELRRMAAEVERDLHRFGSNYLYAGNPPCQQCDVALGSTEDCPTCAAKRAEDRAKVATGTPPEPPEER
jgi:hypothetical protein